MPAARLQSSTSSNRQTTGRVTRPGSVDPLLLIIIGTFIVFGLTMVYDASVLTAQRLFDDKYHFLKNQVMWVIIGLTAMIIASKLPLPWWKRNSRLFLLGTITLLVLVLIPGISDKTLGARRWLNIGGFSLQPSELAKITMVLYLGHVLESGPNLKNFLKITCGIIALIVLQPDLGTSLVLAGTAFSMYWVSGARIKEIVYVAVAGILGTLALSIIQPYRMNRLLTFLKPEEDPLGTSYHVRQILLAIGSGGWFGLGFGQSRQKYAYLPEVATDSIFAIICEELGFIGASIVIACFVTLFLRGIKIAATTPDPYWRLVAVGLISWLIFQTFINLSAMTILVPLTGIPLPLISYGGSSLVVCLTTLGLLLNISKLR